MIARYRHAINKVNLTTISTLAGTPLGSPPTGAQLRLPLNPVLCHTVRAASPHDAVCVYNYLGIVQQSMGDFGKAIDYHLQDILTLCLQGFSCSLSHARCQACMRTTCGQISARPSEQAPLPVRCALPSPLLPASLPLAQEYAGAARLPCKVDAPKARKGRRVNYACLQC